MWGKLYHNRLVKLRERGHLKNIKGMDKIIETVTKYTYFFINMELGQHLPVIDPVPFL
jgi:hypothetical protein